MSDKRKKSPSSTPFELFRRYLIAGVLLLAPIGLTFWVLRLIVRTADGLLAIKNGYYLYVIPAELHPDAIFGFHIPGLGLLLTLAILPLFGLLARNFIGKTLIKLVERLVDQLPIISSIYNAFKQVFDSILHEDREKGLGKVVLVEFPLKDCWSIAFVTGSSFSKAQRHFKKKMLTLLVPTTPNPTTGFMVMVAEDDVLPLEITSEEAFKLLLSFGIVTPDRPAQQSLAK